MSKLEVQTYGLSDLNTALRKTLDSLMDGVQDLLMAVTEETQRLEGVRAKRVNEVRDCKQALRACESQVDREGNRPSCYGEQAALRQAQQQLDEVKDCMARFNDQIGQDSTRINEQLQQVETIIGEARAMLERLIQAAADYLQNHPEMLGDMPGWNRHGSEYRRAKNEYLRRIAADEYDHNIGSHISGWARNDQRYGGEPHTPPTFDVSHRVAGINIPEVMGLNDLHFNRRWGAIARRHNLPRTRM